MDLLTKKPDVKSGIMVYRQPDYPGLISFRLVALRHQFSLVLPLSVSLFVFVKF